MFKNCFMHNIQHIGKYLAVFVILSLVVTGQAKSQENSQNSLSGIVRNDMGDVLAGVSVSIPEKFIYANTDNEGKFMLSATPGDVIFFLHQGYLIMKKEIEFGIRYFEIVLSVDPSRERFEVAYGSRTKNELTHAISVVSSETLTTGAVPNLSNAIAGRASGLTVLKNSGDEPGYDNSSFFIRGTGTFSNHRAPLVLVDHVERDFSQLDPMEIESFSVLKDAAATVQYGMRGANGIINVRTKRGITGKPQITFSSQAGLQVPSRMPEYLSAAEYVRLYNKALLNDGLPLSSDSRFDPEMYNGSQDPYIFPDIDWYQEFLKNQTSQQLHKLAMRGGTTAVRYFMFMGVTQQDGIYRFADINPQYNTNPKFSRYNLRSNVDVDISPTLLVAIDLSARVENRHVPNSSAGNIFTALSQLPPNAMPVENRDGSLAGTSVYRSNPLGMISRTGYRDNYNRILFGNAEATQKLDFILNGLSATGIIGLDGSNYYSLGRSQQYAVYQEYFQNDTLKYTQFGENRDISLDIQKFDDGFSYMFTTIGGLTYFNTFGNNSLGADLKYMQSKFYLHGNNFAFANQGIFGRITYGMKNTYFAEVGFAYNGSENFSPGNRYGFFPAVSAAWVISNESFMTENNSIAFLKLRGSYGLSGSSQLGIERFPFEESYFSGWGYTFGSAYTGVSGAFEGRIPNPGIQWEESANANLGIDLELKQSLNMSLDVFSNQRNKIITTGSNIIPSILGQNPPYVNNGSLVNQGIETKIKYTAHKPRWGYSLQANVSYARNRILNMDEVDGLMDYQYMKGKSATAIWGLEATGLFGNQDEIANSPQQTFDLVKPGDIRFKDQNGDNIIDEQDRIVIGNSLPDWNFGLLGTLRYGSFDLHFVLHGIMGRTVMLTNNSIWVLQNNSKATAIAYQAWEAGANETNATYPRLTTLANKNNYNNSTFWAYKGDFLRVSNIELGYNLSKPILERFGINEIRFFVNAHNLLSFDYTGKFNLDPEVPNAGVGGYPIMRVFNAGTSIKF